MYATKASASVAQSVERGPFKPVVAGSSPAGGVLLFLVQIFLDVCNVMRFTRQIFNQFYLQASLFEKKEPWKT
jgi:hypothetical protein